MPAHENSKELVELRKKIKDFIIDGDLLSPEKARETFDSLCLDVFRVQYANIASYKKFCMQKGASPDGVKNHRQIPAVPVQAFKAGEIFLYSKNDIHMTFKTSGTSKANPGIAHFSESGTDLSSCAIVKNSMTYLFPDAADTRFFLIAPPPAAAPNLTMVFGITEVMKNVGTYHGKHYMGKDGIKWAELFSDLEGTIGENVPATIIAPSFAMVFILDKMGAEKIAYKMPAGSRVLDAGGFKGRSREISRPEMVAAIGEKFSIPAGYCVNTLGMSELGTQYYDNNLKNLVAGLSAPTNKENPHWARTYIADPENGFELIEPGESSKTGALVHFDLTDIDRALAIVTDDLGRYSGSGFEMLGRFTPGDLKGCSLTIEEMLTGRQINEP